MPSKNSPRLVEVSNGWFFFFRSCKIESWLKRYHFLLEKL